MNKAISTLSFGELVAVAFIHAAFIFFMFFCS